MSIKSIHFTNAYHATSGGIRTFYRALLAEANHSARQVRLVVPAASSSIEDVGPFGRIYHLAAPRSPVIDSRYRLILPHRFALNTRGPVWQILKAEQPDLIEICDKYTLCHLAGLVRRGWLGRRPALVGLTCERMDDNVCAFASGARGARAFARWYMNRVYARQFDCHIAVSRHAAEEIDHEHRDVQVCGMGVDADLFHPGRRDGQTRARLFGAMAPDPRAAIMLYAGRLSHEKNLPLLLLALEALRLPGARAGHLVVVGSGPLAAWMQEEGKRRAPGRVHVWAHVSDRERLTDIYANADIFVHPNPREPFGIAPLEAMASGTPLVAPAAGGILAYANDRNAWLAEPTGASFARAIQAALSDNDERVSKSRLARQTAEAHHWRSIARRYFRVYDDIHTRYGPGRHAGDERPSARHFARLLLEGHVVTENLHR